MTNEKMQTLISNTLNWLETPEAQTAWILHLLDTESAGDKAKREELKEQAGEAIKEYCGIVTNKEMRGLIDSTMKHLATPKAQAAWILAVLLMHSKDDPEQTQTLIRRALQMIEAED